MQRRAIIVATVAVALACTSIDLGACGDKYLKVGQSTRLGGYAALYRSSILVYSPANATAKGIKDFEGLLKRAGHKAVFVRHGTALAPVAAGGRYDLVIANYVDAAAIQEQLQAIPSKPDVLPILNNPSKGLAAQVAREYPHLITPHSMSKIDVIDQIDHVMERRLKSSSPASKTK